mgnify:CR=1 FL=1|tara:strand:- start:395 stop:1108 length:714 start_codon:yes stop_codon:yes gene_type:complete
MISFLYNHLNILYKKFFFRKKYFSFSGVDVLIENIFRNKKKGFYVDVGCQHPIKNNNTYLLHKKGWSGLNIDLDQDNINLFNLSRSKDTNICIAISSTVSEKNLFFYHNKSPINTIDPKVSKFQKAKVKEIKKIKTNTLNNILDSLVINENKIDLLSVDVEGHELDVFYGLDFDKYSPDVIVVEFLDLSLSKIEIKSQNISRILDSNLYKFIISKNYTLVNFIYADLVFVKNSSDIN